MSIITSTGKRLITAFSNAGNVVCLLGHALLCIGKSGLYRWRMIFDQFFICGAQSLPVTIVVGIFTGMILALQTGLTLKDYHLENFIGVVILVTMCKEAGPFMTAFILSGRVGSAMAAELGTMKVSEEIDALEVMSIDPVDFLVMPRMIALAVFAPILTIYVNFLGVLGGAIVAQYQIGLDFTVYFSETLTYMMNSDLTLIYGGLFKGMIFGAVICVVSCSNGLRAENGAEGVGSAARKSVVDAFLLILIFNYFMSSIIEKIFG